MHTQHKAFGLWSAVLLGIGSMVGAGIFVLLGEAGAIAGSLVWVSFILGGIIALHSGYSLAKLATAYPSRGGIVEYLVQCYGEGVFSGSLSVLFYLSAIGSISILFIHAQVHIGHLLKIKDTQASKFLVILAIVTIAVAIVLALNYTSKHIPNVGYFIAAGFVLAFIIEIMLRLLTKRVISPQSTKGIFNKVEEEIEELLGENNGK